ncbi:MAG: hypothetical protein LBS57_01240 [Treponema sp.]|jgi:hypothetical protein|nr:hypothetical protein [Treponema sp.]
MKIITTGCLLGFVIVLCSCGQNPLLGDFTADSVNSGPVPEYTYDSENLAGSSIQPAYLTPPLPFTDPPLDSYEYFFNYRLEKFAPETEPFITERFGSQLGIKQDSLWEYPSYSSCAVGFSSSLPAISAIEYGETSAYGSRTDVSESYFYNHLYYLKNLDQGTTYHYRVIIQDHSGAAVALPDRTFTTKTFTAGETKLYQGDFTHSNPNYEGILSGLWITSPGVYVLMEDITTDGLGINVKSNNVTIDLNGHTLTYDNGHSLPAVSPIGGQYNESGSWGIRSGLWNFVNTKLYNGVVKQGGTGTGGCGPVFLIHMGGATQNEVAGITIDYYSAQTSGMYTGKGPVHHNLVYDRGNVVTDRHMAVRALVAEPDASTEVAYNSLRRFRQRGIDGGTLVRDNELYCDSFDTNSFALGAGNGVVLKNNKIFGMGYNPIGIGWGNNLHVADNFIYLWAFAPSQRSEEYGRKSAVAGMRVTNYDYSVYENMLFEGNVIVLKATDHATMARGIWTTNGIKDSNILYRHNTVKVEAMSGNFTTDVPWNGDIYYNGDVNNAIAAVTIQGKDWTSGEIPRALVFEDNRFLSNVNHIIIGEGYGITSGVRFYRTTLEKIEPTDSGSERFFAPVRIGFWYWNTLENRMIDTKLVGITEEEMIPAFYGGTGKMEMYYGERKTFRFTDGEGRPLARKTIGLATAEGDCWQTAQTDAEGRAGFDLVSVKHYKHGNSLEHGGITGTPAQTDYQHYIFRADGYRPYSFPAGEGQVPGSIMLLR